jgi:hypothetical protein
VCSSDLTNFDNEAAEQFSRGRCAKYQKLLKQPEEKIREIKNWIETTDFWRCF